MVQGQPVMVQSHPGVVQAQTVIIVQQPPPQEVPGLMDCSAKAGVRSNRTGWFGPVWKKSNRTEKANSILSEVRPKRKFFGRTVTTILLRSNRTDDYCWADRTEPVTDRSDFTPVQKIT